MINDNSFSLNTIGRYTYEKRIPQNATIELLTLCNLKCEHCYIPEHDDNGLEYSTLVDLFVQLRRMGTMNLVLTGGELFLRKDIIPIITIARNLGFRVALLSNATLLTEEQIRQLAELYIEVFSTTIFSLDAEINDSITGVKGSLYKILENILKMKDYGIKVEVKTPLMKKNKFAYKDLQVFCDSNNFNYIPSLLINSRYNGDRTTYNLRIDREDLLQINQEIGKLLNVEITKLEELKNLKDICPSIRNNVYIDSSGDVFPCNSFMFNVGNIKKQQFKDIWLYSKDLKYLTSITKEDLIECTNCELEKYCTRCPGRALLEDGSIFACSSMDKTMAEVFRMQY